MQNQIKREITFDTQLKTALYAQIKSQDFNFYSNICLFLTPVFFLSISDVSKKSSIALLWLAWNELLGVDNDEE